MYVIALALNHIRDINAKMLPQLPSRKRATWYMKSPLGLQIKLQKAGFCYFAIGLFVLGLSYGSIFGDLDRFFKDNPLLQSMLSNKGNNYVEQFLPQLMLVMSLISTIPSL
ncbi:ABC transporter permease, partial [Staphylococcus aureus]|nr:ABC transporter permease [Staphylococcus aureus]